MRRRKVLQGKDRKGAERVSGRARTGIQDSVVSIRGGILSRSENRVKYDIVFMDINMEKVDGIQAAMQMRSFHSNTYLVLVTAFINYVLEGYKVNAVRYIMKDTLDTAIAECMDAIMEKMKVARVSFSFVEGRGSCIRTTFFTWRAGSTYAESVTIRRFWIPGKSCLFPALNSRRQKKRLWHTKGLCDGRLSEQHFIFYDKWDQL